MGGNEVQQTEKSKEGPLIKRAVHSGLKFLYANIDTFTNKYDEIIDILRNEVPPFDLIAFNEIKPKYL